MSTKVPRLSTGELKNYTNTNIESEREDYTPKTKSGIKTKSSIKTKPKIVLELPSSISPTHSLLAQLVSSKLAAEAVVETLKATVLVDDHNGSATLSLVDALKNLNRCDWALKKQLPDLGAARAVELYQAIMKSHEVLTRAGHFIDSENGEVAAVEKVILGAAEAEWESIVELLEARKRQQIFMEDLERDQARKRRLRAGGRMEKGMEYWEKDGDGWDCLKSS